MNVDSSKADGASWYVSQASWIGLATGAPGSTATPSNEASGSSPGGVYERVQSNWSGTTASRTGSPVLINAPNASSTAELSYTHVLLCKAKTGNTMFDWAPLNNAIKVPPGGGQIVVTPSMLQA